MSEPKCQKCNGTGKVEMPTNLKTLRAFFASGASDTLHWEGVSPSELDRVEYMPCPECAKRQPPNDQAQAQPPGRDDEKANQ